MNLFYTFSILLLKCLQGNLPFRRMCVDLGAEVTCGEMALATCLLAGNASEYSLIKRHPSEKIFGVQLAGGYPDAMTMAAELIADNFEVKFDSVKQWFFFLNINL